MNTNCISELNTRAPGKDIQSDNNESKAGISEDAVNPKVKYSFSQRVKLIWKDRKTRVLLILSILFFKAIISLTVILLVSDKAN